jgi:predicted nucleic acid-binding protein
MVMLDTSAWVEYLRKTGSRTNVRVRELIASHGPIATTDVVILELLSGARDPRTKDQIWGLLNRCTMLPVRPLFEYEMAADLYVRCQAAGFTPANTNDLLIASVSIGKEVPLLAFDSDFERIAAVSSLELAA